LFNKISSIFFYVFTHEIFGCSNSKLVNQRGPKVPKQVPMLPAQPSQAKRKGPKSTKSQPKRHRTTPSPPRLASSIHVELSPSSLEIQTQQVTSPPRPAPQPQEAPTDVPEQTVDPADLSISSVVPPERTRTAPPQGKVLIIALSPMTFIFANHNHPCNLSVDIIPSTTSADQSIVPTASLSQRREIALKQVSYLISILYIINIYPSDNLSLFPFRNKTPHIAYSLLPSIFPMTRVKKQAPLKQ